MIFAVVPFTLIVIVPTNKKLLDPTLDRTSEATHRLLQDWSVPGTAAVILVTLEIGNRRK